ncbi:MAG TPA: hypothetical protein VLT84_02265 [Acidobacteriota bacterium]|nr:hypothetical protein [Acidobacteriota bacterium]
MVRKDVQETTGVRLGRLAEHPDRSWKIFDRLTTEEREALPLTFTRLARRPARLGGTNRP